MTGAQLLRLPRDQQIGFWNDGRRQQPARRFAETPNVHPALLAYDAEQVRQGGEGGHR